MRIRKKKIKTPDMEIRLANWFGIRRNLIVPNVSWGMGIHECDLLIVTKSGYAWEVEIKVSKADLIQDKNKRHSHCSNKIRRLYFAIPKELETEIEHIPEHAGIILVGDRIDQIRPARNNAVARKLTDQEIIHVGRLASMRVWSLKEKINRIS